MKYRPCSYCAHEGPYVRVQLNRINKRKGRACEACQGLVKESR